MDLSKFSQDQQAETNDDDRTRGNSFVVDSGVDEYGIEFAHVVTSKGGAHGLALRLISATARLDITTYFTNKKGETTYTKDGKKHNLPGFNLVNSLALLTVGKEFSQLGSAEKKTIKLYNFDERKEMPTDVNMVTALCGQKVLAGIVKEIVDKNHADPVPGETREQNVINKFFCARDSHYGLTLTEIKGGDKADKADKFIDTWKKDWEGEVIDKSTKDASGVQSGMPGTDAPASANNSAASQEESLFG